MTQTRNILLVICWIYASLFSTSALAGESIGARKIVGIGCHNTNAVCYVTMDGAAFGASLGCTVGATNDFRFDNGDTAIGRRTYAALMAAFMAGKSVTLYLDGCTGQGYPNLIYYNVVN